MSAQLLRDLMSERTPGEGPAPPPDFPPMAETEERIDRLERVVAEVGRWQAAHDARTTELWRQQHQWNGETAKEYDGLSSVMRNLERRVYWLCGAAAAVGGAFGGFMS